MASIIMNAARLSSAIHCGVAASAARASTLLVCPVAARVAASVVSMPSTNASTRTMSSRAANNQRARDKPVLAKHSAMKAGRGDPHFREIWRKFQLKVHPDLFTAFPDLQKLNSDNLAKLQAVLTEAKSGEKTTDDYVKPRNEQLEFYMRTEKSNAFIRVPLALKLPGGNCKGVLAEAIAKLFSAAGLPTTFHWGPEYWQSTYTPRAPIPEEAEFEEEDEDRREYRRPRNRREGQDA